MPLSEDEQRILQEIEKNFYDSDPAFAREVGAVSPAEKTGRKLRWSVFSFVAGLLVLILGFTESVLLGFLGFAVMVGSGFVFYVNAAKLGRSLSSVSARTGSLSDLVGRRSQKVRDRLRKRDD
ncbi:MAG TPA: DUF3040 domain-containing protein [Acidimicrobiales bacterium]